MRRALCPLLAGISLLAAGCGSGGGSSYDKEMHAILAPAGAQLLKQRLELERVRTPAQARAGVERLRATAAAARRSLEAVDPPADAAAGHRRLVAGFAELERDAGPLARLARGRTVAPFLAAATRFERAPVFAHLAAAIAEIEGAGHDLGLSTTGG